jgi:hypothetical protein
MCLGEEEEGKKGFQNLGPFQISQCQGARAQSSTRND